MPSDPSTDAEGTSPAPVAASGGGKESGGRGRMLEMERELVRAAASVILPSGVGAGPNIGVVTTRRDTLPCGARTPAAEEREGGGASLIYGGTCIWLFVVVEGARKGVLVATGAVGTATVTVHDAGRTPRCQCGLCGFTVVFVRTGYAALSESANAQLTAVLRWLSSYKIAG